MGLTRTSRLMPAFSTAAIAFTLLLLPASAGAAPLGGWKGEIFRWDIDESQPALTWAIDSTSADVVALVQDAFQQWEDVPTAYVTFTQIDDLTAANIQVKLMDALDNPFAAGLSYPYYANGDATITSCELQVLNSVLETYTSDTALQIFTHEIGHCLGLGHSVVEGAVMSYRNPGSTLIDDDKMALTARYPTSDAAYPTGCASPPLALQVSRPFRKTVAHALGATGFPLLLISASLGIGGNRRKRKTRLTAPRDRG